MEIEGVSKDMGRNFFDFERRVSKNKIIKLKKKASNYILVKALQIKFHGKELK